MIIISRRYRGAHRRIEPSLFSRAINRLRTLAADLIDSVQALYKRADSLAETAHAVAASPRVRRAPSRFVTAVRHRGAARQDAPARSTERRSRALDDTLGDVTAGRPLHLYRSHRAHSPAQRAPRGRIFTPTAGLVWMTQ